MSLATILRTAAIAATLAALALPAAAASVKINIAGLDAKTAHAQIVKAAATACSSALADQSLRFYSMSNCIDETVTSTEAKFAASERHFASVQNTGH